jgi:hypothetical protein
MKKLLAFSLLLLFFGCAKKETPKPANLIPEDTMVDILYDINLLQSLRNTNYAVYAQQNINPETYIYTKYSIDSLQFAESNQYYITDVDNYEKLLDKVIAKVNEEKTKYNADSLQVKRPKRTITDSVAKQSLLNSQK